MTSEQNKTLVRRYIEASIDSDPTAFKELLAPDFIAHLPAGAKDRDAFVQHNSFFISAFSDRQFVVQDQIAEGDRVMSRAMWDGRHSGEFMGLPATGKQISVSAVLIERVKDGKIVEHWALFDQLSMMQQLGLAQTSPIR